MTFKLNWTSTLTFCMAGLFCFSSAFACPAGLGWGFLATHEITNSNTTRVFRGRPGDKISIKFSGTNSGNTARALTCEVKPERHQDPETLEQANALFRVGKKKEYSSFRHVGVSCLTDEGFEFTDMASFTVATDGEESILGAVLKVNRIDPATKALTESLELSVLCLPNQVLPNFNGKWHVSQ